MEEVEDLVELVLELLDGGERSDDPVALAVAPKAPLLGSLKGPMVRSLQGDTSAR